jgi:hypothetical protein
MKFSDSLISQLKNIASQTAPHEDADGNDDDDFIPMDWFGGNFDDTYEAGIRSGKIELARMILAELEKESPGSTT